MGKILRRALFAQIFVYVFVNNVQANWDFGGMYGPGYSNPATNAESCPAGYAPSQVFGTPGLDRAIYLCQRSAGAAPFFDFGGMFGYANGAGNTPWGNWIGESRAYPNPATGRESCPDGFMKRQILGTSGFDWPVFYCYRPHIPATASLDFSGYDFGGVFGNRQGGAYPNPAIGTPSCPIGFSMWATLGTVGKDHSLKYCVRSRSLAASVSQLNTLYFVAKNGNDAWSGRHPAPIGNPVNDGPFATLERARDAIRALKAEGTLTRPVKVVVRGGDYLRTSVFALSSLDSGSDSYSITYQPYPGEWVRWTGAKSISGFEPSPTNPAIYQVRVPESVYPEDFRSLFVNGRRAIRSRFPNVGWLPSLGPLDAPNQARGLKYRLGAVPALNVIPGKTELVTNNEWMQSRYVITQITGTFAKVMGDPGTSPAFNYNAFNWFGPARFYLENSLAFLDSPGEWHFDPASRTLSYWPRTGEDPTTMQVLVPILREFVLMQGNGNPPYQFVSNLNWENMTFQYSDWGFNPTTGAPGSQAAAAAGQERPVSFSFARQIGFRRNVIRGVGGGYAIYGYGRDLKIERNEITDAAGGGVQIGGGNSNDVSIDNVISDNRIHHFGHVYREGVGIAALITDHATISHNQIHDGPYSGISVGWRWRPEVTSARSQVIENNRIFRVMRELRDGAGIYTLGTQAGSIIRKNIVFDVRKLDPQLEANWLDFGGMWGHTVGGAPIVNPATGQASCPSGYTATAAAGTYNQDHALYYCQRPHVPGVASLYDFGGMYGYGWSNGQVVIHPNPITRTDRCPTGYLAHQALGTQNLDWPLFYCYRPSTPTQVADFQFGGMYSRGHQSVYVNTITQTEGCPHGYQAAQAWGTANLDAALYACWIPAQGQAGIYLDEASEGFLVRDNLVYGVGRMAMNLHRSIGNGITNNIFAESGQYGLNASANIIPGLGFIPSGNWFTHNIVYSSVKESRPVNFESDHSLIGYADFNAYFSFDLPTSQTYVDEIRVKMDSGHSLAIEPGFVAPAQNNFILPANAPAVVEAGFVPIAFGVVGPRD
ncbi:MAG: right-handed parallel beta-helix repeat-containing protein [Bacteriovoracia bacterium]